MSKNKDNTSPLSPLVQQDKFVINTDVISNLNDKLKTIVQSYSDAVKKIKEETENLLDDKNWSGEAKKEFKAAYTVLKKNFDTEYSFLNDMNKTFDDIQQIIKDVDDSGVSSLVNNTVKVSKIGK